MTDERDSEPPLATPSGSGRPRDGVWSDVARMEAELIDPEEAETSLYNSRQLKAELARRAQAAKKAPAKETVGAPAEIVSEESDEVLPRVIVDPEDEENDTTEVASRLIGRAAAAQGRRARDSDEPTPMRELPQRPEKPRAVAPPSPGPTAPAETQPKALARRTKWRATDIATVVVLVVVGFLVGYLVVRALG